MAATSFALSKKENVIISSDQNSYLVLVLAGQDELGRSLDEGHLDLDLVLEALLHDARRGADLGLKPHRLPSPRLRLETRII